MHTTIAYRGDLAHTAPSIPDVYKTTDARCLVWSIDLTGVERPRQARRLLRSGAAEAFDASRTYGGLRHLVITYRGAVVPRRTLRFTAQGIARRLHSEFERARGRYIDVVVIDLTGIDHPELLSQRVVELADTGRGIVGYAAISWENLRGESIRDSCIRDIV